MPSLAVRRGEVEDLRPYVSVLLRAAVNKCEDAASRGRNLGLRMEKVKRESPEWWALLQVAVEAVEDRRLTLTISQVKALIKYVFGLLEMNGERSLQIPVDAEIMAPLGRGVLHKEKGGTFTPKDPEARAELLSFLLERGFKCDFTGVFLSSQNWKEMERFGKLSAVKAFFHAGGCSEEAVALAKRLLEEGHITKEEGLKELDPWKHWFTKIGLVDRKPRVRQITPRPAS